MSWQYQTAKSRAKVLADFAPQARIALKVAAMEFDHEQIMPGPTGELNRLTVEPRGSFICRRDGGDETHHRAYIAMALLAGNTVIICGENADALCAAAIGSGVASEAVSAQDYNEALAASRLSGVTYIGEDVRAINRDLAARDGGIVQLVWDDPVNAALLHRFVTERTVTINTAAIGGNADLLGIGAG